jgi:hypothetical protein
MKLSGWPKKLFLLLASTVFSLFLAEAVVRIWFPRDMVTNSSWYKADPVYRFRHRSNLDRELRWGTRYHLKTNSQGLREDRDIPYDPAGKWRVLIYGDSFTFGNGVERPFIFPKVAEDYLLAHGAPDAEVVNMGVSAHGPSLEYLYFQEEGKKYRPRVVVIAAFPGNDVMDEVRDKAYTLENGKLVFHPYHIPFLKRLTDTWIYQLLINHSQLLVLVRQRLAPENREIIEAYQEKTEWNDKISFAVTVWTAFMNTIKDSGAVPVLMILPAREQILAAHGSPVQDDPYAIAGPAREAMLQACRDNHFTCLDLLPAMAEKLSDPDDAFIHAEEGNIDFHYNKVGHAIAGEELGKLLLEIKRSGAGR